MIMETAELHDQQEDAGDPRDKRKTYGALTRPLDGNLSGFLRADG